ncbi:hypothetical protein RJ639_022177 [Escallonia herrerae]|uniref:sterol 3beta-glucosyltransferase n=1 Tax=Escallonia herrerae TaxID=1293975 RepID=A0AA88V6A7_9ASTE|nr:hypothetical protein RJ639_022177 [Escallonia herrerae]
MAEPSPKNDGEGTSASSGEVSVEFEREAIGTSSRSSEAEVVSNEPVLSVPPPANGGGDSSDNPFILTWSSYPFETLQLKLLNRIATVKDDGTVEFEVPGDVEPRAPAVGSENVYNEVDDEPLDSTELHDIPPMQIVMLIVGTRGDVQPFIAIGKRLQDYGHRVRLATHSNFKEFVLTAGLEFYPLGGDPKVLAGYMVKNKGFLPSGPSEIPIQRNQIKEIIYSLHPACKDPDVDSGISFKADAIIANPPAYGHTHVAEALNVPIHIFFTMPWTPTSEFPHPLSRVKQSAGYRLSYQIVDSLIWLGIRDMINDVRKKKLKLRPVTYLSGSQGSESDVPHGYIWSPHLVPKPKDWGPKVDVVGFCFLDLASNYEPPESLLNWLNVGTRPIYIGFGSLPVQEPEKMTQIIVQALEITGQRGIINKGWGGLGDLAEPKDFIYSLDNIPHDWLFLQCAAVTFSGIASVGFIGLDGSSERFGNDSIGSASESPLEMSSTSGNANGRVSKLKMMKPNSVFVGMRIAGEKRERVMDGLRTMFPWPAIVARDPSAMAIFLLLGQGWSSIPVRTWWFSMKLLALLFGMTRLFTVHHGGAGTTAAGLKAACPTTIVPFFGDQPFWGERVHARGVGPAPIPVDEFSLPKLVEAINYMLDPTVKARAVELAKAMENEDGVTGAVKAFLKHLPRRKPDPEPAPAPSSLISSVRRCFGCS